MSREKKLAKNTLIITIGKVSTQLISFILLPVYTGILTTKEYGIVDLLNTIVSLMLPIVTLQIEQALFRELIEFRNDKEKQKIVISTSIITVTFQCILFLIIFMFISPIIKNIYKYFLAVNVVVYIFLSLLQQTARGLGKNKDYAIGSFISALFTIIFNILFLIVIKLGAYGMLIGTICGQLVAIIYLSFILKLHNYICIKKYKKEILKKLLKYSIPLIPNAICWWVFNASDRVIVSAFLGLNKNGVLAASLKFSSVMITFYNIFNLSWTESISLHINDEDIKDYFTKMFCVILKIFISIGFAIIVCMPFAFPILVREKFIEGYTLVPISIIAAIFHVIVGLTSVIYVAKKKTKAIANTSLISAIINIAVHLSLIKFVGLYAAVISTFVAFFIMSIYRLYDIKKKYFKIEIGCKFILLSLFVLLIITAIYYINNIVLNIFSIFIVIIYILYVNKDSINTIKRFLKIKFRKYKVK